MVLKKLQGFLMQKILYIVIFLLSVLAQNAWASLNIQHWQTANGVKVYFVENHDLPILDVSIEFAAGSSMDTRDQSGLANLVRHLLSLGAKELSEDQIATALADIGAQLNSNFDRDRAGIALRTLSSERERVQALNILANIIQFPLFPEAVLTREKARIVASIKESSVKPDYIADLELNKMLYGTHPYGLNDVGEIETLNALHRDDLLAFYRSHYVAKNTVVAMIGDVTHQQAKEIAESLTKHLPIGEKQADIPQVQIPAAGTKKIPHPATQSHIHFAYPGLRRGDPDYFPLLVGNHILGGGGFVSRLMEEIRQKRGLAYSVYSFFSPFKQQGPFLIGLQTQKKQSEEAFSLTQKVLIDFVASGPTQAELDAAKQNLIGGFPLRIDSNSKILGFLAMIGFYQLPLTYLSDYLVAVETVTVEQVHEAFKRRIQPNGMVAVIVGAAE
jgi:zinc protease